MYSHKHKLCSALLSFLLQGSPGESQPGIPAMTTPIYLGGLGYWKASGGPQFLKTTLPCPQDTTAVSRKRQTGLRKVIPTRFVCSQRWSHSLHSCVLGVEFQCYTPKIPHVTFVRKPQIMAEGCRFIKLNTAGTLSTQPAIPDHR